MATSLKEVRTQTLMFDALEPDGTNFLEWNNDMTTYLCAEELNGTLHQATAEDLPPTYRWQALLIIRRHMDASLRQQYVQLDNPAELWAQLQARFKHEQTLFLPQARNDWVNLRVLDFPNFQAFNAELHRLSAQLRLCGDRVSDAELIDKTLSTFPPATSILSQQYRNMKFTKHAELMSYLLLAEKQQQILLKNAESRPAREVHATEAPVLPPPAPDTTPAIITPEVHNTEAAKRHPRGGRGGGRGRGRGHDHYSRGRTRQRHEPYDRSHHDHREPTRYHQDHRNSHDRNDRTSHFQHQSTHSPELGPSRGACFKCGRHGHYARECRAPQYVWDMYQELKNLKEEKREAHTLDAPSFNELDPENYMVQRSREESFSETALLDSASTHTILRDPMFFESSCMRGSWLNCDILTIAGSRNFKFREGRATVILPGGFPLKCERAMYAPAAPRSLISYRDLRANGIHIFTHGENDDDAALELRKGTQILTKVSAGTTGLYALLITADAPRSCNLAVLPKAQLWHRRLGHPGTTIFRRMVPALNGHNLSTSDTDKVADCTACIRGKYSKHPSKWQLPMELPQPLQRLHGDICGPINPPSGPFSYFLVLVDASGAHAEVSLLTTRNMAFPKILAMILRFRAHFPDKQIQTLRMDNAREFRSHAFEDFCTVTGIELTYSVPYEHSQNGLAEAFIKKIQLVSRPLLLHAGLPTSMWGHAVLHAATLLRLRPTLLNTQTSLEIVSGRVPNISHLRVFGCQVWVPAPEPQLRTISAHRIEGIYIGFDSPSIIRYLTPTSDVLHKARFANCRFLEEVFPLIPSAKTSPLDFCATQSFTMNPDPRTALAETEVQKILHLHQLATQIPDSFDSGSRILRNPIPGSGNPKIPALPKKRLHRTPTAPKTSKIQKPPIETPTPESGPSNSEPEAHHVEPELAFPETQSQLDPDTQLAIEAFLTTTLDPDPVTLDQAKASPEWPEWQVALQAEYSSLRKRAVFGPLTLNLPSKPIGYKLVFTRKRNEHGQIVRYKVRCVAQGFNQRPGIDFDQTYSPVMDCTSFRYLLTLAVQLTLATRLVDVVTAYLYGELDVDIHIRPPPEFLEHIPTPQPGKFCGLKLCKALYGLKQAGRAWYHHLRRFLTANGFTCHSALPCIFVLRRRTDYVILAVYVDDINLVGTHTLCTEVEELLTSKFEMKLLGKTSFCLGLQVHHLPNGSILLHQEAYTKKLLQNFNMDAANPLSAPMIGRSKTGDDPYRPCEEEEEEVDPQRYLAAVGALLYLATHTRPDISFAVSVLARHSRKPTHRHWAAIKHLMRYLRGTEDVGLHYTREADPDIVGYADSGFKTDETNGKSQTGYIFIKNGAPISWKSVKQTITATSTNHAELMALHEAAREAIWLRTMIQAISEQCGIIPNSKATVIHEDNAAAVAQVATGFIKADRVKHISPTLFGFMQDLVESGQVTVTKIESAKNISDMLTKALPTHKHRVLMHAAGMRSLQEL